MNPSPDESGGLAERIVAKSAAKAKIDGVSKMIGKGWDII
jgi:hypothetical protein